MDKLSLIQKVMNALRDHNLHSTEFRELERHKQDAFVETDIDLMSNIELLRYISDALDD